MPRSWPRRPWSSLAANRADLLCLNRKGTPSGFEFGSAATPVGPPQRSRQKGRRRSSPPPLRPLGSMSSRRGAAYIGAVVVMQWPP